MTLVLLALPVLAHRLFPIAQVIPATYGYWGLPFIVVGAVLLAWAMVLFKRHGTTVNPVRDPSVLVVAGPYGFSRNPMYLGFLLVLTGMAILLGSVVAFLFPLFFFILAQWVLIPYEEAILEYSCVEKYPEYRRDVRRWL